MLDIYLSAIVSCPLSGYEQDADQCLRCQHYQGHQVNSSQEGHPRLHAKCGYSSPKADVYKSTLSGTICTIVSGEPFPPTVKANEKWTRVKMVCSDQEKSSEQ